MALQIWPLNRGLQYLRQDFDDVFDKMLRPRHTRDKGASRLAVECYVEEQTLFIRADLPGVEAKNVEVTIHDDILTIRGTREREQERKSRNFVLREVSYGTFQRSIRVPRGIDVTKINATCRNGVFEVSMPLPAEFPPSMRIQIGRREPGSQVK